MKRSSLPPGFRFHPTHVELVMFYLKKKVLQKKLPKGIISELDIYKYAPWDLPDKSCLKSGDLKWYFFCPRERKYASGGRMNRATAFGFWKSTGRDRHVVHNNEDVGQIKTLTFFRGKAPNGDQTDWVMHEYRIEDKTLKNVSQNAYVLCVIFQKNGPGPRNGAQYGAPFNEEDWEDNGMEEVDSLEVDLSSGLPVLPGKDKEPLNSFAPDTSTTPSNILSGRSASCISENLASTSKDTQIAPVEIPPNLDSIDDDVFRIEDIFPEYGSLNLTGDDEFQDIVAASKADQNDTTYNGLEDLGVLSALNGDGNACVAGHEVIYGSEQTFPISEAMFCSDQMLYLEMNDLNSPLSSNYQDIQMSNFNAAYNYSNVIEQPSLPFSSFGAANHHVPPFQDPSLHRSNDQISHSTDLGYSEAHMYASGQSAWLQENVHPNSNGGCNGHKTPCLNHDVNLP